MKWRVYSILWSGCLHVFLLSFHKGQMTICVSSNIPCGKGRDWMSLLLLQLCQYTMVCLCADCSANWHRLWQNQFWEPADSLHLLLSWQTLASTAARHWSQLCQPSGRKYHFLDLILVYCIAVEQVNIPDVADIHRHNCWSWYFYMYFFLPIILPHLWFRQFTNKHRNEINFAVGT